MLDWNSSPKEARGACKAHQAKSLISGGYLQVELSGGLQSALRGCYWA